MNNSELCIPSAAISQSGEDSQSMAPEVGDAVEVTIGGTVSRAEGGNLYIKPTSANGQPIAGEPGESSMEDEDAAMDKEMEGYRGGMGVSALVTLGILAVLAGILLGCGQLFAAPRDTGWATRLTSSGGAVSNYVAFASENLVFDQISIWFTNAPNSGDTLTIDDRIVTWTNNTAANTNHLQTGATAALSATALSTYAASNPFSNIVQVSVTDGTNAILRSLVRKFGETPIADGASSATTRFRVINSTNYIPSPQQVFHVEIGNHSGSTLYLMVFDSATNQLAGARPHLSEVPIPTGSVGGKSFGASGCPFVNGINICLSTTPFALTNASAGGVATVICSKLQ